MESGYEGFTTFTKRNKLTIKLKKHNKNGKKSNQTRN